MGLSDGYPDTSPDRRTHNPRRRTLTADRALVGRRQLALWLTIAETIWNTSPVDSDHALLAARLADEIEQLLVAHPDEARRRSLPA